MLTPKRELEIKKEVLKENFAYVVSQITRKSELGQRDPQWRYFLDLKNSIGQVPVEEIDFDRYEKEVKDMIQFYENKPDNAEWQAIREEWIKANDA